MPDEDFEELAQKAGEERLAACQEALYAEENGEPIAEPYPGLAPFDGCDVCIVREILDAAWPFMLELARKEAAEDRHWTT